MIVENGEKNLGYLDKVDTGGGEQLWEYVEWDYWVGYFDEV